MGSGPKPPTQQDDPPPGLANVDEPGEGGSFHAAIALPISIGGLVGVIDYTEIAIQGPGIAWLAGTPDSSDGDMPALEAVSSDVSSDDMSE